ncbi:hypothetical protein C1645_827858 [Glomus cerebriforme]|uniref:Peptidase A2 domain-containing protein n=1 Tax=Glomus cerebriforme TaxID=658196 RepID=A0A397SR51_9GLOM|nr:hypothetical protein C1645_827858 [Glomus cerebriforme]
MRRYCFNQITNSEFKIDVQSGYNIIFFYQVLESGEFLGHENEWIMVYNQEIMAYKKKYSDDELNHIFKKMPGAIQFPVNQKSLPCSKKRKIVTTNCVNDGGDYKVRASVRRPEASGLVVIINYDLYDHYNNNKRYECVMDTGAPSMIFSYHIKRTLQGNEKWNINPIISSGYGGGSNKIIAKFT